MSRLRYVNFSHDKKRIYDRRAQVHINNSTQYPPTSSPNYPGRNSYRYPGTVPGIRALAIQRDVMSLLDQYPVSYTHLRAHETEADL
eukprot:3047814-Rhodomonas_salina.1